MKSLLKIIYFCLVNLTAIAQSVTILPNGITPAMAGNIPSLSYDAIMALPSPSVGSLATDITFNCLRFYDGQSWAKVLTSKDSNPTGVKAWRDGGTGGDTSQDIVVDAAGNIYITGNFFGTTKFGNISLTSDGSADIFIAKYNKNGVIQWAKRAGSTTNDAGQSVAVDNNGNVFITGYFSGTASFGNTTLTNAGSYDIFIAKYTSNGTLEWVGGAGGNDSDSANKLALDTNGNAYITGSFTTNAVFGSKTIISKGESDVYIAKYSTSGNFEWVKTGGGANTDNSFGMVIDGSGTIYITGIFYTAATFGGTTVTAKGFSDIFVAKYSPSTDSWLWTISAGGPDYDLGKSIALDGNGNLLFGGGFQGVASFDNLILTSDGGYDVFLAKCTADGNILWIKRKGGKDDEYMFSMGLDAEGNIYTTGFFHGVTQFGNTNMESLGASDIFFAKFTTDGVLKWAQSAGGPGEDYSFGLTVQPNGDTYATGQFYSWIKFGSFSLNASGDSDIFIAKVRD